MSKLLDELKWVSDDYDFAKRYSLYKSGQKISYIISCSDHMHQEEIYNVLESMKKSYTVVKYAIQKFCRNNPEYTLKGEHGIDIEAPNGNNTLGILTNKEFRAFLEKN